MMAGGLWNPRRNRTEHMTDPLALGAVMYSRNYSAAQLTEEAIWLFGNQAVEKLSQARSGPDGAFGSLFPTAAFTCWQIRSPTRKRWWWMPVRKV